MRLRTFEKMVRYLLMVCLALGLGLGGLVFAHSACGSQKSCHRTVGSGCCCKKKQARICTCEERTGSHPAIPNNQNDSDPSISVWLVGRLAVLYLLLSSWSLVPTLKIPIEWRARGPTSFGLNAFQLALPPPA